MVRVEYPEEATRHVDSGRTGDESGFEESSQRVVSPISGNTSCHAAASGENCLAYHRRQT